MITLELVSEKTFKSVIHMKLEEPQSKYVASNVISLAQAWLYYDETKPYAVMNGDEVVGFMMLDWDENERTLGIWRFMIATEQQRKGYGRQAMLAAIQLAKDTGKFDMMHLDYVEGNVAARELYYSLGFRENGEVENDEIIMTLPLTDHPIVGWTCADMEEYDDFVELVEKETEAGNEVPIIFRDKADIEKYVKASKVDRFTIMGKTIAMAVGDTLLLNHNFNQYQDEVKERMKVLKSGR